MWKYKWSLDDECDGIRVTFAPLCGYARTEQLLFGRPPRAPHPDDSFPVEDLGWDFRHDSTIDQSNGTLRKNEDKMKSDGARTWVFADGYLPSKTPADGRLEPHEALMVLNTGETPANVSLDFYFDDKEPVRDIPVRVGAERVICIRLDHPEEIGGVDLPPLTQYALRVRSDVKVVVQFGRLDATQANLAYYVNVGFVSD